MARGLYESDRRAGTWTFFTPEGKRSAIGHYERGQRSGAWTFFRDDGRAPSSTGGYHAGRRRGRWTIFETAGVVTVVDCRDGYAQGRALRRLGPPLFARARRETVDVDDAESFCKGSSDRLKAFDDFGYNVEAEADGEGPG
jgi:hypothetical protein